MMFLKNTKKKKSKHITNKRLTEWTPCEICRKTAASTHEVFGAANRNRSIKYGAQVYLCLECHHRIDNGDLTGDNTLERKHQIRIMKEYGMTKEQFIKEFGKSYLEVGDEQT